MKPVIVATPELADAFGLAGLTVYELDMQAGWQDQALQIIQQVLTLRDVAIVLVDERFVEFFERGLAGRDLPLVASFPVAEVHRDESYVDELCRRYLGQKIHVEGEGT